MLLFETDLAVRHDSRLRPDLESFSTETWQAVDIKRIPVAQRPDVAVEVISSSETATNIQRKVDAYLNTFISTVGRRD
jgi:Uma2 family endonuclease